MGRNNKNSPVIGENGITANREELAILTKAAKDSFVAAVNSPPVNLHDNESVTSAIIGFFDECERTGKRPGNMGLYRALGLTRQEINHIASGRDKNKVSPIVWDTIKKACLILSEYREQLGAQNKLNPATLIFWQKNFDSLTDTQTIELTPIERNQAELSPEQIQKAIEQDIPIDVE